MYKKLFIFTFLIALSIGMYFLIPLSKASNDAGEVKAANNISVSVFGNKLAPEYGEPKSLVVKSANISVDITKVNLMPDGTLETPTEWSLAGWYKGSASPGEPGVMVINAHYDDNHGNPAAFWGLKSVKAGDTVTVLDSFGKKYNYKVVESTYVDINDPNRLNHLNDSKDKNKASLVMITCGGVWVPGQSTYNKRLIVRAELVL